MKLIEVSRICLTLLSPSTARSSSKSTNSFWQPKVNSWQRLWTHKELKIQNLSAEAVDQFLRCLYTGKLRTQRFGTPRIRIKAENARTGSSTREIYHRQCNTLDSVNFKLVDFLNSWVLKHALFMKNRKLVPFDIKKGDLVLTMA